MSFNKLTEDETSGIEEFDLDALAAFLSDFVDWEDTEYLEGEFEALEASEGDLEGYPEEG